MKCVFRAGDDLLLMSTPPPGGKSGATGGRHPAARALEEQVLIQNALSSGEAPPCDKERNNVDELYANSPQTALKQVCFLTHKLSILSHHVVTSQHSGCLRELTVAYNTFLRFAGHESRGMAHSTHCLLHVSCQVVK